VRGFLSLVSAVFFILLIASPLIFVIIVSVLAFCWYEDRKVKKRMVKKEYEKYLRYQQRGPMRNGDDLEAVYP